MSTILIGLFLLLYGIMELFHPAIPAWVLGLVALLAGILVLAEGFRPGIFKRGP